ncbi:MAG: acyltransferase [Acidobacteria bacterium]|nr:acyltransferase [Acidobacteriota bacterium]
MKYYFLQLSRFLAALYVVLFHKLVTGIPAIDFFIIFGDVAVSFFFILSGFVIASSLLRRSMGLGEYLARRCLKILPQWYLSILLSLWVWGLDISPFRLFLSTILMQTVYPDFSLDVNFVGWSLSVELIMYLILFFVFRSFQVGRIRFAVSALGVWLLTQVIFIMLLRRGVASAQAGFNVRFFLLYHPIWHLSSFLIGIACAANIKRLQLPLISKLPYPAIVLTACYLSILFVAYYIGYKIGINRFYHNGFFAPVTGLFIVWLVQAEGLVPQPNHTSWKNRVFDTLGGISFGIYLFHIPLYGWFTRLYPIGNGGMAFVVYLAVLLVFCYVCFRLFDQGLHRLAGPWIARLKGR